MKQVWVLIITLFCVTTVIAQSNIVREGNARFTVLSPQMIRMEYDSTGKFVDEPSFVFNNRNVTAVSFKRSKNGKWLILKTDALELKYKTGSGKFNATNLLVLYAKDPADPISWHPGKLNSGNLKGTFRTLDGMNGDTRNDEKTPKEFENGLLSRDGWCLIDDSNNFLFDNSTWKWVKERKNPETDWYFIGYGSDYKSALYDFTTVAGKIPLPPRYAFGYWWSRYWNYSDKELRELVAKFEQYSIPLDVLVIDMDWHTTDGVSFRGDAIKDEFGETKGWTGYTWNKSLFPDPDLFLNFLKAKQIRTTLNLHPASGIAPTEEKYNEFAKTIHFDTVGHRNIPFEVADKKFMTNLFNVVLDPLQNKGVSFWWLDWQQWPYSKTVPGLSNTWWLNYCFFSRMEQQNKQRPMLYHRWGGLGNHRYQIGFSGDVDISWKSLDFQPYFTATASNVLYGYWSHDLGGHGFGNIPEADKKLDPEMYTRWMQYGVFSPIFRTHSSKDPRLKKEVWNFTGEYFEALQSAIQLRYDLNPYIYTMARKAYDTGISLCRPMYYDYPKDEDAYTFKNEYMFGDDLLIMPITAPAENDLSTVKVWLPEGNDWYEWSTGTLLKGGQTVERQFLLNEYPVFVKSGAIIPMSKNLKNLQQSAPDLVLKVFPGNGTSSRFYEDQGDNSDYEKNSYSFTTLKTVKKADGTLQLTVSPREGSFPGMIEKRNLEIELFGSVMPASVFLNGVKLDYSNESANNTWNFSGNDLTVHIHADQLDCSKKTEITVQFPSESVDIKGVIGKMSRLKLSVALLKNNWFDGAAIPAIISSTNQAGLQIEYKPSDFNRIINSFNTNYPQISGIMGYTFVNKSIIEKCNHYLKTE